VAIKREGSMSDTEMPRDGEEPDRGVAADEPVAEEAGLPAILSESESVEQSDLVIIPGGGDAGEMGEDDSLEAVPVPGPEPAEEDAPVERKLTLDELVAEMAGGSAAVTDGSPPVASAPVMAERVDTLENAMPDTFADALPVEAQLWKRLPFWVLGATWVVSVGVMTYLLWPMAKAGLADNQLYGILVFGGAALVAGGLVVGLVVWFRARSQADHSDRGIVGRAVLLRALGWTAVGVALWVVSMIVLSLHSLDVIP
jgi:hypothetical protein